MHAIHRFRTSSVVIGAMLAIALSAPAMAQAEGNAIAMMPAPGPSSEDISGYASVEASRAAASGLYAPSADDTTRDATIGARSVEENRVLAAQRALQSHDLGSMQEEALTAIVAVSTTWDETSGYDSVEASRAGYTIGLPIESPPGSVDPIRVSSALESLQSGDLGGVQEEALAAIVAAAMASDDASGYRSVEASRAAHSLPVVTYDVSNQVPSDARWAPAPTVEDLK